MRELKRYITIFWVFARNSFLVNLEYRVNFFAGIFVQIGFVLAKLSYVFLIYKMNVDINGMSPDYMLIFIGTFIFMTGIYMSFYCNLLGFSREVRSGNLDILLTKPISSLFLVSFQKIDLAMPIPNLICGTILIAMGWTRSGIEVTFFKVFCFILFMILGCILTYGLFLLPRLLAFFVISTNGISQICESLWDFNNMPQGIYGKVIQNIGTFVFPIFLITNMPGIIIKEPSLGYILCGITMPFVFLFISIKVWNIGIKNYTSASS